MNYQIEVPVPQCHSYTYRSTDINNAVNEHLKESSELSLEDMQELLNEIKIRFDTNPNFYLKNDYKSLINFISQLFNKHKASNFGGSAIITTIPDYSKLYIAIEPGIYNNFLNSEQEAFEITEDDFDEKIVIFNPKFDGTLYYEKVVIDISKSISTKVDKVKNAVEGNLSSLDNEGNLVDSGKKVGSSTLEENPNENTLATEQAVQKAIDDIEIQVAENDPLLRVNNQKKLFSTINLKHVNNELQLLGQNDVILAEVSTSDFIKDGILDTASFGFYIKKGDDYIPSEATDPEALPYVVLTFNTDAGKTPIYLSFNYLVSYTIDAAKEQLWAELQKYIDETKEELNNSTEAALDLKVSKVKGNNTKDKIAILTEGGDLQNSEVTIGQEKFKESSIVTITWQDQRYYVNVPMELIYTDLTNTPIYSDMFFKNEVGYISGQGMSGAVYVIINNNFAQATIGEYTGFMPNIVATELGVENYITSYVSTYEDINNILNTIP